MVVVVVSGGAVVVVVVVLGTVVVVVVVLGTVVVVVVVLGTVGVVVVVDVGVVAAGTVVVGATGAAVVVVAVVAAVVAAGAAVVGAGAVVEVVSGSSACVVGKVTPGATSSSAADERDANVVVDEEAVEGVAVVVDAAGAAVVGAVSAAPVAEVPGDVVLVGAAWVWARSPLSGPPDDPQLAASSATATQAAAMPHEHHLERATKAKVPADLAILKADFAATTGGQPQRRIEAPSA